MLRSLFCSATVDTVWSLAAKASSWVEYRNDNVIWPDGWGITRNWWRDNSLTLVGIQREIARGGEQVDEWDLLSAISKICREGTDVICMRGTGHQERAHSHWVTQDLVRSFNRIGSITSKKRGLILTPRLTLNGEEIMLLTRTEDLGFVYQFLTGLPRDTNTLEMAKK